MKKHWIVIKQVNTPSTNKVIRSQSFSTIELDEAHCADRLTAPGSLGGTWIVYEAISTVTYQPVPITVEKIKA